MTVLVVHPASGPLRGVLAAPPSPTTLQLAALLSAMTRVGAATRVMAKSPPPLPAIDALRALGVEVADDGDAFTITGVGLDGFRPPAAPLPCPPDAAAMGALLGLLAARRDAITLEGAPDAIRLHAAAAARVIRLRGGQLEGQLDPRRVGALAPPLVVGPAAAPLSEVQLELSAQDGPAAKAAALTSGLCAFGDTFVHEPAVSDDRLERLLTAMGVSGDAVGPILKLSPISTPLAPLRGPPPGDGALAAPILAAALARPGGHVGVKNVTVSTSRAGWLEGLRDCGAAIGVSGGTDAWGEATADVHLQGRPPRPLRVAGERGKRAGVPLPTLAVLAALGGGELTDVPLPHPAQLPATFRMLQAFGVDVRPVERGLALAASTPRPAEVDAAGDPDLAMAAVALALAAEGEAASRIFGAEGIGLSFPRFVGYLRALGATIDVASDPA